jgi:hypothetical protein
MVCHIITGNRFGFLSPARVGVDLEDLVGPPTSAMPEFNGLLRETADYYHFSMFSVIVSPQCFMTSCMLAGARPREQYGVLYDPEEWRFPSRNVLQDVLRKLGTSPSELVFPIHIF